MFGHNWPRSHVWRSIQGEVLDWQCRRVPAQLKPILLSRMERRFILCHFVSTSPVSPRVAVFNCKKIIRVTSDVSSSEVPGVWQRVAGNILSCHIPIHGHVSPPNDISQHGLLHAPEASIQHCEEQTNSQDAKMLGCLACIHSD